MRVDDIIKRDAHARALNPSNYPFSDEYVHVCMYLLDIVYVLWYIDVGLYTRSGSIAALYTLHAARGATHTLIIGAWLFGSRVCAPHTTTAKQHAIEPPPNCIHTARSGTTHHITHSLHRLVSGSRAGRLRSLSGRRK